MQNRRRCAARKPPPTTRTCRDRLLRICRCAGVGHPWVVPFDEDLHERVWRAFNSELSVRTDAHGLIARSDGCAAWVDAVDVYSSVARVRTCLIVTPHRAARAGAAPRFSWIPGLDEPVDLGASVATAMQVDGHPLSTSDDTLHHTSAGWSSDGMSEASWWMPRIPTSELAVTISVPTLDLEGTVTFDTSSWSARVAQVLSI